MQGSNFFVRQGRTVYTGDRSRSDSLLSNWICKLILIVVLVVIPLTLINRENYQYQLELAFSELEHKLVEVDASDMSTFPQQAGAPVYFTSEFTGSASDHEFGVTIDHALKLDRQTEYCQWQEFSSEECDSCTNSEGGSYKCNCRTTYYYQKGWVTHPIISAFFDQPFNHNNPQRDPYPSMSLASENTIAGEMYVEPSLLLNTRGTSRTIQFLHPGQAPPSYSFWKFFGWKDNQRYEGIDVLRPLTHSPAYREHQFSYTGQEGWFFSPYEADMASELLKKMGQFLEGSLFDWQLADLMPGCTAGDIRVRFRAVDPRSISVVGKYVPQPTPRVGIIDNLNTATIELGLVHAGDHSYNTMVDAENWNANVDTWLWRAITLVIWTPCAVAIGLYKSPLSAAGGSLLVIAVSWTYVYGISDFSGPSTAIVTVLLFAASGVLHIAGRLTSSGHGKNM